MGRKLQLQRLTRKPDRLKGGGRAVGVAEPRSWSDAILCWHYAGISGDVPQQRSEGAACTAHQFLGAGGARSWCESGIDGYELQQVCKQRASTEGSSAPRVQPALHTSFGGSEIRSFFQFRAQLIAVPGTVPASMWGCYPRC